MIDENAIHETADQVDEEGHAEAAPRRPWWKRAFKVIGIAAVVLVVTAWSVYSFGGMMPPTAKAKSQYAQLEATRAVRPVEQRFHIPIPGCVCHSDNPVLQVQHSKRSLSQCASCHSGSRTAAAQ